MPDVFLRTMTDFFTARATRLHQVFGAAHTREHWTQAEAFLHFRDSNLDLRANTYPIGNRRTADFSRHAGPDGEARVVSEFKIYGTCGFFAKNLTGYGEGTWPSALQSPKGRFTFGPGDQASPREGSILRDYHRLLDFRNREPAIPAVLLLAVVNNGEENRFGSAIRRVDFGRRARVLVDSPRLLVKAWRVTP